MNKRNFIKYTLITAAGASIFPFTKIMSPDSSGDENGENVKRQAFCEETDENGEKLIELPPSDRKTVNAIKEEICHKAELFIFDHDVKPLEKEIRDAIDQFQNDNKIKGYTLVISKTNEKRIDGTLTLNLNLHPDVLLFDFNVIAV